MSTPNDTTATAAATDARRLLLAIWVAEAVAWRLGFDDVAFQLAQGRLLLVRRGPFEDAPPGIAA